MVALLIKEETDAFNSSPEEKYLLSHVFGKYGKIKSTDFLHLMSISTKHEYKAGSTLVHQGDINKHIHLVYSGKLVVKRDSDIVVSY